MSKSYVIFAKCGNMWIFRSSHNCENRLEQLYLCGNCKYNYIDGVVPVCGVCTNQNSSKLY